MHLVVGWHWWTGGRLSGNSKCPSASDRSSVCSADPPSWILPPCLSIGIATGAGNYLQQAASSRGGISFIWLPPEASNSPCIAVLLSARALSVLVREPDTKSRKRSLCI